MIRLRAHVLALCVLVFLPFASWAASIKVTTPFDLEVDNDDLCSVREAVTASMLAIDLSQRTNANNGIKKTREDLEKALLDIQQDPANVTYPRNEMLEHMRIILEELPKFGGTTALVTEAQAYQKKIQAIGTSRGPFDLSVSAAYPGSPEPGFYTYIDADVPAQPVDVTSALHIPAGSLLTYVQNDRAYWDGTSWRKYAAAEQLPVGVDEALMIVAIDLHERSEAALTAEIDRIKGLTAIDGCDDGTAFDTVQMEAGKVYFLNRPLNLSTRLTIRGADFTTVIARCPTAPEAADPADLSRTCAAAPALAPSRHRLVNILAGATIEMIGMTLRNGDAGTGGGGAIELAAPLLLDTVRLENNHAAFGGAIHSKDVGTLTLTKVRFTDNAATGDGGALYVLGNGLQMTDVLFGEFVADASVVGGFRLAGNTAGGNGGGIALMSALGGGLSISRGAFAGNQAVRGSAIYFGGAEASVTLENVTIARNMATAAGTLDIDMPALGTAGFLLNNVTMIRNTAANGSAGIRMINLKELTILNSVIAGNTDLLGGLRPDCDLPVGTTRDNFRRNFYGNPEVGAAAADVCPGLRFGPLSSVPERENFELGALALIGGLVSDINPASGPFYVPVFPNDVNDSNENRLVNRGAGVLETGRCATKDQRDFERSSSVDEECDIGAVEYQIGRRKDDSIEMLVDERRCLNVIGDDLGDALYVPGSLRVLNIERAGATAIIVSRAVGTPAAQDLNTVCANAADIPYQEAILFTPGPGFRGETNVIYGLDWRTATPAPGVTPVVGSITAVVHVDTESRGGITSSTIGAVPPLVLLGLAVLLAFRRLRMNVAAVFALLAIALPVQAAENVIYVNSSLDELISTPGDKLCTLREALDVARNDRANMTGGDCLNGNEGPDIIEFAQDLEEVILEDTVVAYGTVTLRCPLRPEPTDGSPRPAPQTCTIRRRACQLYELDPVLLDANGNPALVRDANGDPVCAVSNPAANPNQFRLIDSRGSLVVNRFIFTDGLTPDRGAGQDGGAIFSTGSLSISDSIFRNNSAVNGGAIFLAGTNSALNISSSTFTGNRSRAGTVVPGVGLVGSRLGGGGAIATSQSDSHKIAIQSSSFISNRSTAGAAAVDLNTRTTVAIGNATFTRNISTEGPGAIDVSGALGGAYLRNNTVLANQSGLATVRETWESPSSPLPAQRPALQFGTTSVVLTSSVVAANVTQSNNAVAANCPPASANSSIFYNVFGDEDDPNPAVTPDMGNTCSVVASGSNRGNRLLMADQVFDQTTPANGYLSALIDVIVGDVVLKMHVINNPVTAAGILVDAGYNESGPGPEDNQVDPTFSATLKCAATDARGGSRSSGGRCDIGAFEVLGITAADDAGSNGGRRDRLVPIDIIANDLFDDISALPERAIKKDCDTVVVLDNTPAVNQRTYRYVGPDSAFDADSNPDVCVEVVVQPRTVTVGNSSVAVVPPAFVMESGEVYFLRKNDLDDLHIIRDIPADTVITVSMLPRDFLTGRFPEDYVTGWDWSDYPTRQAGEEEAARLAAEFVVTEPMLASGYVLVYDNHGTLRDKDHGLSIALKYRVYTVEQLVSNTADIEVGLENVPPRIADEDVVATIGSTVTFNVLANDVDDDAVQAGSTMKVTGISGTGCKPFYDATAAVPETVVLYWQCEFGQVTLNAPGTITWVPTNAFNPFTQVITYDVSDEDPVGAKAGKGTLTIKMDVPEGNGGAILGKNDLSNMLGIDFLGAPGPVFFLLVMMGALRRRY